MLLHLYATLNNLLEFEIYFTEDCVSTNQNWQKYRVTLLTHLSIKAQKSLIYICYNNRFGLTWTSCFIVLLRFQTKDDFIEFGCNSYWHGRIFQWKQSMVTILWHFIDSSSQLKSSKPNLNSIQLTCSLHHSRHWNGNNIIHKQFVV